MYLSGHTPLFRAKNLERYLGIDEIYLKLEGANPTGQKNDRITEALIRYCQMRKHEKVLIYGSAKYIESMLYFAEKFNVEVHVPTLRALLVKKNIKEKSNLHWANVVVKKGQKEQGVIEKFAMENNMFLLSEEEEKPFIRQMAMQQMMEEILDKIDLPTDIWMQSKKGYSVKSIYHELMRHWIKGEIYHLPSIHVGIDRLESSDLILHEMQESTISEVLDIKKPKAQELTEAVKLIKSLEGISITKSEAYSLAQFINAPDKKNGKHIIMLNDGKNDIGIENIGKREDLDIELLVQQTREFLNPYHDSLEETRDAIINAAKNGFILKATKNKQLQGLCIIVNMGFEDFIPTYHLAYIGVKDGNSGRGIATLLINQAVEMTQGKLSLHVDIPNKRAKKLYEKMGFVHCYDRMLFKP